VPIIIEGWSSPACRAAASRASPFDTIYAEGPAPLRRILSAYARQFPGPDGEARRRPDRRLSPAISIDQKGRRAIRAPPSARLTEIYDHMRLLFARVVIRIAPTATRIQPQSVQQISRPDPGAAGWLRASSCWVRSCATARRRRPRFEAARKQVRARPVDKENARAGRGQVARQVQAPHDEWSWTASWCVIADDDGKAYDDAYPNRSGAASPTRSRPAALGERRRGRRLCRRCRLEERLQREVQLPLDGYTIDELEPRSFSFKLTPRRVPGRAPAWACAWSSTPSGDRPHARR